MVVSDTVVAAPPRRTVSPARRWFDMNCGKGNSRALQRFIDWECAVGARKQAVELRRQIAAACAEERAVGKEAQAKVEVGNIDIAQDQDYGRHQ